MAVNWTGNKALAVRKTSRVEPNHFSLSTSCYVGSGGGGGGGGKASGNSDSAKGKEEKVGPKHLTTLMAPRSTHRKLHDKFRIHAFFVEKARRDKAHLDVGVIDDFYRQVGQEQRPKMDGRPSLAASNAVTETLSQNDDKHLGVRFRSPLGSDSAPLPNLADKAARQRRRRLVLQRIGSRKLTQGPRDSC